MATITSVRLILTDLVTNHNKFWHGRVEGTTLYTEWGRVGDIGQKKAYAYTSQEAAEKKLEQKKNEKLRKGYTEQYTTGELAPINTSIAHVARTQIIHNDPETEALIDFLVTRNIHAIEGSTSIRMEAGKLTTPLGPVTEAGLDEAQAILTMMAAGPSGLDELANKYMRIVPRTIGRGRTTALALFGSPRQIEAEQATLDSLRAVVKDVEQRAKAQETGGMPPIFQAKLELVASSDKEFKRIHKKFEQTKNSKHQSINLKLQRVWSMSISSMEENFEATIGNIQELWHGTKDHNLLSILKSGYVIPKRGSSIAVTGRMYGDGIYFSDQSTKSLNYASGYWGGGASQRKFMLLNDVAMGKEYTPDRGWNMKTLPKGYDSCFAKAGSSGVMNNEMIVYRTSQVNPTFLCEFG